MQVGGYFVSNDDVALAHGRLLNEYLEVQNTLNSLMPEARRIGTVLATQGAALQQFQNPPAGPSPVAQVAGFGEVLGDPNKIVTLIMEINATAQKYFNLRNQLSQLGLPLR